jgi:hypothetical protein
VNQNKETEMDDEDVHSGTGPCCWYREGTTASVVDIISSTEANNPLVRAARPELMILVLSSCSTAELLGCAAFRNDSRHVERLG